MIIQTTRRGITQEHELPYWMDMEQYLRGYTLDGTDPIDSLTVLEWLD